MLVGQIARDPYSTLTAALNGWSYAPNPVDAFFLNWVDAQAQMNHRSGKVPPKPVPRPWERPDGPKKAAPGPSSAARREALRERLGLGRVVYADDQPDGQPESEGDDRHQ